MENWRSFANLRRNINFNDWEMKTWQLKLCYIKCVNLNKVWYEESIMNFY